MADGMKGIEKLRRASTQTRCEDCRICEASGIEIDCDEERREASSHEDSLRDRDERPMR